MILVLGGTLEGREIAGVLAGRGARVLTTVASGYGAEMLSPDLAAEVLVGQLDAGAMDRLITEREVKLVIDATHPYAREITGTAWAVAKQKGIPYIRYERPPADIVNNDGIYRVKNYEEAAAMAVSLGETILLTIGSRNLAPFIRAGQEWNKRIVARVLPDAAVLAECSAMGLAPADIIAVQGPFSEAMNLAMFREYKAAVLVTKDSGKTGGTDTKLAAAASLGLPVIIVARPVYSDLPVLDRIADIISQAQSMNLIKIV